MWPSSRKRDKPSQRDKGVAERHGDFALLGDGSKLHLHPGLQGFDPRPCSVLSDSAALVCRPAANLGLDGIEVGDSLERLGGDRRKTAGGDLVEWPADVAPTESQLHLAALGELSIAGITVDLQHAAETLEMGGRTRGLTVRRIDIGDRWRSRSTPWSVVTSVDPELAGLGPAAPGIEHRRGGLVGKQLRRRPEPIEQMIPGRSGVSHHAPLVRPSRPRWSGRDGRPGGRRSAPA